MKQTELTNLLLDQSEESVWVVNLDFQLIYANTSFLNHFKEMIGVEKKVNNSIFADESDPIYVEKWKAYYRNAFGGKSYKSKEQYLNPKTGTTEVSEITFEPLIGEDNKIFAVSCKSKNITSRIANDAETSQMIDALLDVFCTINEQGQFIYVSAASLNHWGYLPEELIGNIYLDYVLEEDVPKTIEIAGTVLIGKEVKSFVNRYNKKDGGVAYNLWSIRWDPITKLMYCIARDCADKIKQDELVQNSELRFKALVQEGSDLISILDIEGNYLYVSPTSISILGIAPEDLIGRNPFDFIHPDDKKAVTESLAKVAVEKKVKVQPFRFQNQKKEYRWIESILTNMLDNPAVNGIVANSRDITDQIKEKHKLKLLESVITNTKDSVLITEAEPFDEPGPKILYVNEAFTKMTGYTAEEVIGKTPRILQDPKSDREELTKLSKAIRNWKSCEITTLNYKKSGEEFWINFSVTPVADDSGWYTHWIAIERDITEQKLKELENELIAQISLNFNAENDYFLAVKGLCESVGKFGDFDMVEVWISNLEKSEIFLFNHYIADPEDGKFYDDSYQFKLLKMSESLAGTVWSQKMQLLWDDSEDNINFLRRDAAKKIGLKSILGIPLIFNDEVVGVLKVGSKKNSSYLKHYTRIFRKLERFIGSELNRKNLENDVNHLFNAIPGIVCLLDIQGKFLKINNGGCVLLGYNNDEIKFHYYNDFVHPQDRAVFNTELDKINEESEADEITFKFENRFLTKSGEAIWLSWYCTRSFTENLIYATANNVTEEKKLRELNQQVGLMAKIGSWEVNLVHQTLFWSDEIHLLHETDPKSFVPQVKTAIEFYREDFRALVESVMEKGITTGEPFDFEAIIVTANKKELWVRSIGNVEFVNGVCTRIYGGFQDINNRKLDEVKLAESENRFRTILEVEPECIKLLNSEGILLMMNPAGLSMIEADNEEQVIGKSVLGLIVPQYKSAFLETIKNVFNGATCMMQFQIVALKGTTRWMDMHAVPMRNEEGEIINLLGVTRDITQRKKAEEEKTSFQKTIENSLNEIYIFDANTLLFTYVNKVALLNLGYPEEEIRLLTPVSIKPDFTEESFRNLAAPLLNNEEGKIVFFTNHQRKDKSLYPVEVHLQLVEEGNDQKFLAVILDITERKKAEERILNSNERFEKVTEATNDAIWDWDMLNESFYRSKAIERFFGPNTSVSLVENEFWKNRFHPEDLVKIKQSIAEAIENPSTNRWEAEYRIFTDDNQLLYVSDRGLIIRNNEGKAIRMVGAMSDITEQKRMTLQLNELNQSLKQYTLELERSNEELEQFAFVASHDLQEPLRMISSFMDLLSRKYGHLLDEKAHQYIHFATDGAKRMKQIILDLLDYSRASRIEEAKEKVDINEILSDFKQLRRRIILEKSAVILVEELPILVTYKAAITQIIHCLLDNALQYCTPDIPPIIEIKASENEKEWEFSIRDNGIGIDPQFYEKIFLIFQRLHNKDQYTGTGIGLSIAKRNVEFLGGRIWLESVPNSHTVFYFIIPKINLNA